MGGAPGRGLGRYPQARGRADVHDSQHRLKQNRAARIAAGVCVCGYLRGWERSSKGLCPFLLSSRKQLTSLSIPSPTPTPQLCARGYCTATDCVPDLRRDHSPERNGDTIMWPPHGEWSWEACPGQWDHRATHLTQAPSPTWASKSFMVSLLSSWFRPRIRSRRSIWT